MHGQLLSLGTERVGEQAQKVLVRVLPVHPGTLYVDAELLGRKARDSLAQQVLKLEEPRIL